MGFLLFKESYSSSIILVGDQFFVSWRESSVFATLGFCVNQMKSFCNFCMFLFQSLYGRLLANSEVLYYLHWAALCFCDYIIGLSKDNFAIKSGLQRGAVRLIKHFKPGLCWFSWIRGWQCREYLHYWDEKLIGVIYGQSAFTKQDYSTVDGLF